MEESNAKLEEERARVTKELEQAIEVGAAKLALAMQLLEQDSRELARLAEAAARAALAEEEKPSGQVPGDLVMVLVTPQGNLYCIEGVINKQNHILICSLFFLKTNRSSKRIE